MEAVKLYEAALAGDVSVLDQNDASILEYFVGDDMLRETALHVAARFGHLEFATKIISHRGDLAGQLNSLGQSPLHLTGHRDIAKALLEKNKHVCFVRDKDGRTPFHIAAMKGRLDVLQELIDAKKEAAWVLTDKGQPLLHLCVNNNQYEALAMLVKKIESKGFFKLKDCDDNTILHLLVAKERYQDMKKVLQKIAKESDVLDAMNKNNCTALGLAGNIKGRCLRLKIKLALYGAGAIKEETTRGRKSRLRPLKTNEDSAGDHREALMVVAILIATVTYSAALNPPGGVWQEDGEHRSNDYIYYGNITSANVTHYAGQAVMSYKFPAQYVAFTVFNTIAFLASIVLILLLVSKSLFHKKVFKRTMKIATWTALLSLLITFSLSFYTLPAANCYDDVLRIVITLLGMVGLGIIMLVFTALVFRLLKWLLHKFGVFQAVSIWTSTCWNKGLFNSSKDSTSTKDGKDIPV